MSDVRAPFTDEQIKNLLVRQDTPWLHPYTCGYDSRHGSLIPKTEGWVCRNDECSYRAELGAWIGCVRRATGSVFEAIVKKHRMRWLGRLGAWLIKLDVRLYGGEYERTVRDRHGNVIDHEKVDGR